MSISPEPHDHPPTPPAPGDPRSDVSFHLFQDAWGQLVLVEPDGTQHTDVSLVRTFPISDPEHGLSILNAQGHELRWIERLDQLPSSVKSLVEQTLQRQEFLPVVKQIVRISSVLEPSEWLVETDRGLTRFLLNSDEDVRRLGDFRAMIVDAHGVRFLVPDTRALDGYSRRVLERYL